MNIQNQVFLSLPPIELDRTIHCFLSIHEIQKSARRATGCLHELIPLHIITDACVAVYFVFNILPPLGSLIPFRVKIRWEFWFKSYKKGHSLISMVYIVIAVYKKTFCYSITTAP